MKNDKNLHLWDCSAKNTRFQCITWALMITNCLRLSVSPTLSSLSSLSCSIPISLYLPIYLSIIIHQSMNLSYPSLHPPALSKGPTDAAGPCAGIGSDLMAPRPKRGWSRRMTSRSLDGRFPKMF